MTKLRSYPKVWNLGHPAIEALFEGEVVVQEKIDGSQFTFGVIDDVLHCRSKGATIHLPTTDKLFRGACETAEKLHKEGVLVEGWLYRGEAMMGPRHNTLVYGTTPPGNVVLFDVDVSLEKRIEPRELDEIGERLGLLVVPTVYVGEVDSIEKLRVFLEEEPLLGGEMMEGIVIKNYSRWGEDGKMLMGKMVREDFKEKHTGAWKKANPKRADVIEELKETYRNERRWEKAVQHLRDSGTLTSSPRDIGPLLKEVQQDVLEECKEEIMEVLFKHFWKDIGRGATAGLPEWYKKRLVESQFS